MTARAARNSVSARDDAMKVRSLIALWLLACSSVWAAPAAEVTHLSGILSVKKADGTAKILSVKSAVDEGDVLTTETDTYVRLKFVDGGEVVLRPNSQLKVQRYRYEEAKPEEDGILVGLLKGGLRAATGMVGKRNKEKVSYQTPTATIGIRGTHFGALQCSGDCGGIPTPAGQPLPDGLHVDVASGTISISNGAGTFTFDAGQFAFVPGINLPPELVPPERGIRVTMPGCIATNRGDGAGIGKSDASDCTVQ